MIRRSSAFSEDLAGLDALQTLPLAAPTPPPALTPPTPAPDTQSGHDEKSSARPKRTRATAATPDSRGTRATQVRLPPQLADWLSQQAYASGRTLGTVIALAAKTHADMLPLQEQPGDELDVRRRSASGNVPVTLRLTSAQRQLLDDLAADYHITRSAVVVAALTAASTGDLR